MIENKMKLSFVPWIKKKKNQTSIGVDGVLWYSYYYVKCENFGLINDPLNFGFFLKKKTGFCNLPIATGKQETELWMVLDIYLGT